MTGKIKRRKKTMKSKMNPFTYLWLGSLILTAFVSNAVAARNTDNRERNALRPIVGERLVAGSYRVDKSSQPEHRIHKAFWSINKGPWWHFWGMKAIEARTSGIKNKIDYRGPWKYALEARITL